MAIPNRFKLLGCFGAMMAAGLTPAFAGPPLLTDDPGTPGPNNWEINVATTLEKRGHNWEFEAPLLDINYGVGERIQLKYEAPWVVLDPDGAGTRSGAGNSLAGVKWRFLDQDTAGIDVSTYPQIEFNTVESSVHRGLVEDGTSLLLPLELAHPFGPLTVYGEWGHVWNQHRSDQWFYGLAAEYELGKGFSIMAELHGDADRSFHDHELLCNAGLHWELCKEVSLIGSAGRGLHANADGCVDVLGYLGVQLTF